MRTIYSLALACLLVFMACGDDPSGPGGNPTPSTLQVTFTGELKGESVNTGIPSDDRSSALIDSGGQCFSLSPQSTCQITAEWTACSDASFSSYTLYRSTDPNIYMNPDEAEVLLVSTNSDQHNYVDNNVEWITHYYYSVKTTDQNDNIVWSNEAQMVTPGTYPTPSILLDSISVTAVHLWWTMCPDQDFAYYTLYKSSLPGIAEDPFSAENLGSFPDIETVTYVDYMLIETAYYVIQTTDQMYIHSWSNEVCAVHEDNIIFAWGSNLHGQCDLPSPNMDFIAVAGGEYHSLGLKEDGSIVAWGDNGYGQCNLPSPNTGFVTVAAGAHHSMGLKEDGSIVTWGDNGYGQCDVPSPNMGFIAVAGGQYHSLGLKEDGSIVAWGDNGYGQCNLPLPNTGFVTVAAGAHHSMGLKEDGSIVCWGWNGWGQCNVPEPNESFVAIAGGSAHSLGVKEDGSIVAWGFNQSGQCNVPAPNMGFIAVAGGEYQSLGLKEDGSMVAWGQAYPLPYPNTCFVTVAAGSYHNLGIRTLFQ